MKLSSIFNTLYLNIQNKMKPANHNIKTFVFLDLETTGLPCFEFNKTKITELCLVAVESDHIRLGVFPRVLNKLNFCFNPRKMISVEAEDITGLSNHILQNQSHFCENTVNAINSFINHIAKPVCFVAHNGNLFDYPILRAEIEKAGCSLVDDVLCIDSLQVFREIHYENERANREIEIVKNKERNSVPIEFQDGYDEILCQAAEDLECDLGLRKALNAKKLNETTPVKQIIQRPSTSTVPQRRLEFSKSKVSFKLVDVYERFTKRKPIEAHEAENDVIMLVTCAATLGDQFVDWANAKATKFSDVPAMTPGRKLGT